MDFIDTVALDRSPGRRGGARARARRPGAAAAANGPRFPALGDWRMIVGRLLELLESKSGEGLLAPHRAAYQRLIDRLSWDGATHVSSHNDPNARNVLFDGTRLWLVDWETAYRNDPMVDVAIMADNLDAPPELTRELLHAWMGRAASVEETERLEAIRRLTRLYYAGLLIGFAAPRETRLDDLSAPTRAEADERQRRGRAKRSHPRHASVGGQDVPQCLSQRSRNWLSPMSAFPP